MKKSVLLIATFMILVGCQEHQKEIVDDSTEVVPDSNIDDPTESELEGLAQTLESELRDQVERDREALGQSEARLATPKPLGGLPRKDLRLQAGEICPRRPPRFNLDISRSGESPTVTLLSTSGVEACDSLVREVLLETRWPKCDDETVPCQFPYAISFTRHPGL